MKKIPYPLLVIGIAAIVNFGVWLLLTYTSSSHLVPEEVRIPGLIFTFIVGVWYLLTHPLRGKK